MPTVITDTEALASLCSRLACETFVTVDTEFMREKTYYPELCLVQIAGETEAGAIDPLAPGLDLTPLHTLLANPSVLKVFHACRQDIEIFHQRMGNVPAPIFDTQIAAMVCGYGESASYESLVGKVIGKSVDKSSRFTDWSRRPLTEKQLVYAMDDVLHLREIYKAFVKQLEASGRALWIQEEMAPLTDPATYEMHADDAWRKIRIRNTSPRYLASLQAVARWREQVARDRNVPRGRIMKDETLAEVAQSRPLDFASLQAIRGFYPTLQANLYDALFEALKNLETMPSSEFPRLPARPLINGTTEALIDMLRLLLKACAGEQNVVPRILADKEELEALALGERDNIHALQGWRKEIFGVRALKMLEGKLALKADGKNGIAFIEL